MKTTTPTKIMKTTIPLTSKRMNVIEQMKEFALKSNLRSKHCACLVKKNKILCIQNNTYNSHNNNIFCSTHAEISIHRNINKYNIKNFNKNTYDLWVIRYSKKHGLADSKPCSKCIDYMKKNMYYVQNIIYSNENGNLQKVSIDNIKSKHVSIGYKMIQKRRKDNKI